MVTEQGTEQSDVDSTAMSTTVLAISAAAASMGVATGGLTEVGRL